jgi:hypothetical protein
MKALCVVLFAWAASALAQTPDPSLGLFKSVKPQAAIVIQKHTTGADVVEITMLDVGYPPDVLRARVLDLCKRLGVEPRGLNVFRYTFDPEKPDGSFLRASFAVTGLIDRDRGVVRLGPIAQAFAGIARPNQIEGLSVVFAGEVPAKNTLARFISEGVQAEGTIQASPPSLEYRIKLLSQDPDQVAIPDTSEPTPTIGKTEPQSTGADPLTLGLIAAAALAAGALVYALLIRPKGRA